MLLFLAAVANAAQLQRMVLTHQISMLPYFCVLGHSQNGRTQNKAVQTETTGGSGGATWHYHTLAGVVGILFDGSQAGVFGTLFDGYHRFGNHRLVLSLVRSACGLYRDINLFGVFILLSVSSKIERLFGRLVAFPTPVTQSGLEFFTGRAGGTIEEYCLDAVLAKLESAMSVIARIAATSAESKVS